MSRFSCPYNLIIAGVGGQGNVLISQLIARAFIKKKYRAVVGETYGVSQRGGSVMSHIRIFLKETMGPIIPSGRGDLILGLEPMETLRILKTFGNPDIHVITNTRPINPLDVIAGNLPYPEPAAILAAIASLSKETWTLNASELAMRIGTPLVTNMVMTGAMLGSGLLPLTLDDFIDILKKHIDIKTFDVNKAALQKGAEAIK